MSEPRADRRPTGQIAFAHVRPLTLTGDGDPDALKSALVAGTHVDYYGRSWRMGKWREEGRMIVGRIGFESPTTTELWDDALSDFSETARPAGYTAPFAIDPEDMRVAFQVRGKTIPAPSFTNALQRLMDEASDDRWEVEHETRQIPLATWVDEVDRVVALRLALRRPNPHYDDRQNLEDFIEGTNSAAVEIMAQAEAGDLQGLNMDDPFVQEAIAHAAQSYGHLTVVAEHNGETARWSSKTASAAEVRLAPTDPTTREISTDALRRELGDSDALHEEVQEARNAVEAYKAVAMDDANDEEDDIVFDSDDGVL